MLEGKKLTGPSEARLDLICNEHDAMPRGDLAQRLEELRRGGQEATVALHRLDYDRSDAFGSDVGREDLVQCFKCALRRHVAIGIGKRRMVDLGGERAEVLLVRLAHAGEA